MEHGWKGVGRKKGSRKRKGGEKERGVRKVRGGGRESTAAGLLALLTGYSCLGMSENSDCGFWGFFR